MLQNAAKSIQQAFFHSLEQAGCLSLETTGPDSSDDEYENDSDDDKDNNGSGPILTPSRLVGFGSFLRDNPRTDKFKVRGPAWRSRVGRSAAQSCVPVGRTTPTLYLFSKTQEHRESGTDPYLVCQMHRSTVTDPSHSQECFCPLHRVNGLHSVGSPARHIKQSFKLSTHQIMLWIFCRLVLHVKGLHQDELRCGHVNST